MQKPVVRLDALRVQKCMLNNKSRVIVFVFFKSQSLMSDDSKHDIIYCWQASLEIAVGIVKIKQAHRILRKVVNLIKLHH